MGRSLQAYAVAQDKIGAARLAQDSAITNNFYKPWTSTLNNQINAAVKARQHVKSARLSLDAARAKYKHLSGSGASVTSSATASSNAQKIEQARLEVEAAEETLVTATEEAINLMRAVLDNVSASLSRTRYLEHCEDAELILHQPDSLKSLSALVKAQQEYHSRAAEILAGITDTIEESAVAAEVDYRKSRT